MVNGRRPVGLVGMPIGQNARRLCVCRAGVTWLDAFGRCKPCTHPGFLQPKGNPLIVQQRQAEPAISLTPSNCRAFFLNGLLSASGRDKPWVQVVSTLSATAAISVDMSLPRMVVFIIVEMLIYNI